MRVAFTPQAEADLEEISDYIAQDNPERALSFLAELRKHCAAIGSSPLAYVARTELGRNIRSCPHGNYVVFFRPGKADVLIVRILHAARDISRILGEE